jgi:hypothetical protein
MFAIVLAVFAGFTIALCLERARNAQVRKDSESDSGH